MNRDTLTIALRLVTRELETLANDSAIQRHKAALEEIRAALAQEAGLGEPVEGDHDGRQLEWERAENKRLRDTLRTACSDLLAVLHLVPGDYIQKSVASAETAIARDDPNRRQPVELQCGFHEGGYVGPFPACPPGEVGAVLELNVLYPTGIAAAVYSAEPECTSCDGSGEYIDAIGDWRGYCSCAAGVALKNRPASQEGAQ